MKVGRTAAGPGRAGGRPLDDEHRGTVERRRAAVAGLAGAASAAAARIASAPPGYLLAHHSSDVVRHCVLLSPLPARSEARVVVTPSRVTCGTTRWRSLNVCDGYFSFVKTLF